MRLLAGTYTPQELNRVAFGLYAEFRPSVEGWGKKGEVRCDAILGLRKEGDKSEQGQGDAKVVVVKPDEDGEQPDPKRPRTDMSLEEYEAALDNEGYEDLFSEAGA
jgi:hypothetical protein